MPDRHGGNESVVERAGSSPVTGRDSSGRRFRTWWSWGRDTAALQLRLRERTIRRTLAGRHQRLKTTAALLYERDRRRSEQSEQPAEPEGQGPPHLGGGCWEHGGPIGAPGRRAGAGAQAVGRMPQRRPMTGGGRGTNLGAAAALLARLGRGYPGMPGGFEAPPRPSRAGHGRAPARRGGVAQGFAGAGGAVTHPGLARGRRATAAAGSPAARRPPAHPATRRLPLETCA